MSGVRPPLASCETIGYLTIYMAGDWTDDQNDAIVADYFAMLADDVCGRLCGDEGELPQARQRRRLGAAPGGRGVAALTP